MYLIMQKNKKPYRPLSSEEINVVCKLFNKQYLNILRQIIADRLLYEMKSRQLILVCGCREDGSARLAVSDSRGKLFLRNVSSGGRHLPDCPLRRTTLA
ncbi:MAG: hypothetical protein ACRCWW_09185 [Scandinavium sp.]|uniref:hypothetical protein n=1 Tax=Scandinavium sp. TaxID=2830653 RepID=UPI003F3231FA